MDEGCPLPPCDARFLQEECTSLRAQALSLRQKLGRLDRTAHGPGAPAAEVADALVRWIEQAQENSARLHLIRQLAARAQCRPLVRRASAPLRSDLTRASALLVWLRAEHRLQVRPPRVTRPSIALPSGRLLS